MDPNPTPDPTAIDNILNEAVENEVLNNGKSLVESAEQLADSNPLDATLVMAADSSATVAGSPVVTAPVVDAPDVDAPVVGPVIGVQVPGPPMVGPPVGPPRAPRAPRSISRMVMAGLTLFTLTAAMAVLLGRVAQDTQVAVPVPVANPAGVVTPVTPSINTVVAPLNQVAFTPAPPEPGPDLSAYSGELLEAFRPVINVDYTEIVDSPAPWSSHLFGPADLPASLTPPVDQTGKPLCMIAQINLADLPAMPTTQGNSSTLASLPKAGMLQFWLSIDQTAGTGLNLAPSFVETAANLRQRVTYVSATDMASAPAKRVPSEVTCSNSPPARGPAVTVGMTFSLAWTVPETTDNRFDSSLPTLAGALRSNVDEFYRATGAINSLLGVTPPSQLGGFNRLVNQDPRTVLVTFEGESHTGVATDAYEVLFEIHSQADDNERWDIGFGNEGTGGWWADPKEIAKLADADGITGGRSAIIPSAFWADSQAAPIPTDEETE